MRLKSLFASTMFLVVSLCAGAAFTAIGLQHQVSFTVPGLDGEIRQTKFADLDNDGFPEILACDTAKAVLYSIVHDSVLLTVTPDSGYFVSSIELQDVNRDSMVDVVVASVRIEDLLTPTPMNWLIEAYDGADNFETAAVDSATGLSYANPNPACLLSAVDLNGDGINELLLSVDSTYVYSPAPMMGWYIYQENAITRLYHSFPDSVTWHKTALLTSAQDIAGLAEPLVRYHTYYYAENPASPDQLEDRFDMAFLNGSGEIHSLAEPDYSTETPCALTDNSVEYVARLGTAGRLDSDTATEDLLVTHYFRYTCEQTFTPNYVDSSRSDLSLYHLIGSDSTELVWMLDTKDKSYSNFVWHPDLQGYFLGFAHDTLLLFRGSDGAIRDRVAEVPSGSRHWDYPFDDQKPRLVVMNGAQVSLYRLDVATDIEDIPPRTTPASFELGRPYPNPFNAELIVPVKVGNPGTLKVELFNINGQHVATLHDGEVRSGAVTFHWDASRFGSGVYLVRANLGGRTRTVKAVLLK